jgi:hypothetical protein
LIVVGVEELGGELLPAVARVALEDHGSTGLRIRNFCFVMLSSHLTLSIFLAIKLDNISIQALAVCGKGCLWRA